MSSLLEQAIIDAKILRESSIKRAEQKLIADYSEEIKQYAKLMLEQDDATGGDLGLGDAGADTGVSMGGTDMGMPAAEPPPEAKKVMNQVPAAYLGKDNLQEVEINLDSIIEEIDTLQKSLNIQAMPDFQEPVADTHSEQGNQSRIPPDALAESVVEEDEECNEADGSPCSENLEEEQEQLEEELVMDMSNVDPGGISNTIELKKQVEISKALEAQNEELNEQLQAKDAELGAMESKLQSMLSKLQETREKLKKSTQLNVQLKEGFELLSKKVGDVNLLNARLLYTNKVLGNGSLNERQKKQIAESISKSKSVEEAKTIYETLQRSAQTIVEKRQVPQSLTEAVSRASSPFLPRVTNQNVDPVAERWQRIAGIKK